MRQDLCTKVGLESPTKLAVLVLTRMCFKVMVPHFIINHDTACAVFSEHLSLFIRRLPQFTLFPFGPFSRAFTPFIPLPPAALMCALKMARIGLLFPLLAPLVYTTAAVVLLAGNSTLLSPNRTFELGFFAAAGGGTPAWYLGIWYASIPIRTYVWVANRAAPAHSPPSVALTPDGRLGVSDANGTIIWATDNTSPAVTVRLLDTGNLVLISRDLSISWESFDFPSDTWLPEMAVTRRRPLISWRSPSDPSPGLYSLRLRPNQYGEFQLVFNGSVLYWSSGNWSGGRFDGVPEMTVPYIYAFRFLNPFTPEASFIYSETPPVSLGPLLTRFVVDPSGQLMQYTWSPQAASWNMFWSRPEEACRVYARCGSLGVCLGGGLLPCGCPAGLRPANPAAWDSGDFSAGCAGQSCSDKSIFSEIGAVEFEGDTSESLPAGRRRECEQSCLRNCSCFGLIYDPNSGMCRNLYGAAYNLRNVSASFPPLYVRVPASGGGTTIRLKSKKMVVLVGCVCGFLVALIAVTVLAIRKRQVRCAAASGGGEEEFPVAGLRVFTYKELSSATRGFSEKLGHGGFGAVFRGDLSDEMPVAVKRLERPGGGEREFRAEVRTIGSVQHLNLVRLRGFCSEGPHRLLVYDYMCNGSLSGYLGRDRGRQPLSWAARYRIAVGTARGIAYLHEECRDRIIHCDIKPENILLDGELTPKVSDFGLAKLVGRELSRVLATMRGTMGYVAPEWISGTAITVKADVYSYGMTLLEILGGRRNAEAPPLVAATVGEGWYFPPWAARRIVEGGIAEVVDQAMATAGGYDEVEAERVGRVAVWCIQDEEAARPTMGEVVKMLEGAVEVTVPPLPQLLQALVAGDSFTEIGGDQSSGSGSPPSKRWG